MEHFVKSPDDKFQKTFEWLISEDGGFSFSGLLGKRKSNNNKTENKVIREKDEQAMEETIEWLKTVMKYNVPHGKQIRGRMVVFAYQQLVSDPTEHQLHLARILGWLVEILQAASLIADDIMDNSVTRRGQSCWHHVENMGNIAVNDSFLLEHTALQLLFKYFGHLEMYADILNLFLGVSFRTTLGQSLDTRTGLEHDFDKYSMSMYNSIITYKTGYYTVYGPVAGAMIYAGISRTNKENAELWENVEEIALSIGRLFQIQDDYLDCFAEQQRLGKIGNDIQEGKVTWLVVKCIELCTKEEFEELKDNYGSDDICKVAAVKDLYRRLDLEKIFFQYEEEVYENVANLVEKLEHAEVKRLFEGFLSTIYKRCS